MRDVTTEGKMALGGECVKQTLENKTVFLNCSFSYVFSTVQQHTKMNESKFHLILFTNVQHFQSSSNFSAAHFDHRRNPEKFGTDEEDKNNLHADGDCSSHEDGKGS